MFDRSQSHIPDLPDLSSGSLPAVSPGFVLDKASIESLDITFARYINTSERRAVKHDAAPCEPLEITTRWGATLILGCGDYLVSDIDDPSDMWPVSAEIFERIYEEVSPGVFMKREWVDMAPLSDITGDEEVVVTVDTGHGVVTVVAGDFYLCRGKDGYIWVMAKEKFERCMRPFNSDSGDDGSTSS